MFVLVSPLKSVSMSEGGGQRQLLHIYEDTPSELLPEPPRHTRQNPNLSRHSQKSLVADDLDELRRGL